MKKSHSHEAALRSLGYQQQKHIYKAATEYLADTSRSLVTAMRFDVALVDRQGHVQVMKMPRYNGALQKDRYRNKLPKHKWVINEF